MCDEKVKERKDGNINKEYDRRRREEGMTVAEGKKWNVYQR